MPLPKTEIVGNAVSDAKTGTDKNGQRYCFVRVGCSESYTNDHGDWVNGREMFFNVQFFQAPDDLMIPNKGDKVITYGKIFQKTEELPDGRIMKNVVVDADFMKTFPKKNKNNRDRDQDQTLHDSFDDSWSRSRSRGLDTQDFLDPDEQPPF